MKYSLTNTGIIIAVLGTLLAQSGFSQDCTNEILTNIPLLIGGIVAWIGRIKAGGVNIFGVKK